MASCLLQPAHRRSSSRTCPGSHLALARGRGARRNRSAHARAIAIQHGLCSREAGERPATFASGNGRHTELGGHCRSEEHTSELQSLMRISYAVFCLKKKKQQTKNSYTKHFMYQTKRPDSH